MARRRWVARATSSTCPHLGAHLGRGSVDRDAIRCPFHGFTFDGDGRCIATGGGSAPPAGLTVRSWPVRERNGVLLVWHHPHRSPPSFEVPELDAVPMTRLSRTTTACLEFDGHPVATSENSVDLSHLAEVHNYTDVVMVHPFSADGTQASASYTMTRPVGIPGDTSGCRRCVGPRRMCSSTSACSASACRWSRPASRGIGARTRQQVLATPVAPGRIEFRLTMQVLHEGGRLRTIAERIAARVATHGFVHDVHQDVPIWASQRYVSRPALAHGDGPIVPYRRWARQFLEHDG